MTRQSVRVIATGTAGRVLAFRRLANASMRRQGRARLALVEGALRVARAVAWHAEVGPPMGDF